MEVPLLEQRELTGTFRSPRRLRNFLNKNKPKDRTEMSGASMVNGSASVISLASHGLLRRKPIFHSFSRSIREPFAAGLLMITSHQPKLSASSLLRSCGDFISVSRLRVARYFAPHGFVVVPEEPTREMLKAACASMSPGKRPTPDWVPVKEKSQDSISSDD